MPISRVRRSSSVPGWHLHQRVGAGIVHTYVGAAQERHTRPHGFADFANHHAQHAYVRVAFPTECSPGSVQPSTGQTGCNGIAAGPALNVTMPEGLA